MSPVTGTTAIIIDFICIIAALLFLVLRLYVRLRILNLSIFNLQDGLVIFAWLCFLANVVQDVISNAYGLWSPDIILTADGPPAVENFIHDPHKLELVLQMAWIVAWVYYLVVYAVKAALLSMYFELFSPRMIYLRRGLYFTIVLVGAGFFASLGLNLFWCMPIEKNWALKIEDRCLSWSSVAPYFTSVMFHILTDIAVYILPFFLIPMLARTASTSQLLGVMFMFSLGLLSIICVVVRAAMIGQESTFQLMACWGAAEQGSAIMIACCLPLRYLRSKRPPPSAPCPRCAQQKREGKIQNYASPAEVVMEEARRIPTEEGKKENIVPPQDSCVRDWTAGSIADRSANRLSINGGLGPRKPSMAHAELDLIQEYYEDDNSTRINEKFENKEMHPLDVQLPPKPKLERHPSNLTILTFGGHEQSHDARVGSAKLQDERDDSFDASSPTTPGSPSRFNSKRWSRLSGGSPQADLEQMRDSRRFSVSSFGVRVPRNIP